MKHAFLFLVALLAMALAGCPEKKPEVKPVERPLAGVKLKIAVVDDAALAAAMVRVQGEWNVQTDSDFEVIETTEAELLKGKELPADAVVCPSHVMGLLAERDLLSPVPDAMLRKQEWSEIFPLLRMRESAWAGRTFGVPFGSPVFCCYYRADVLEKIGRRPPKTWSEYQELTRLIAKRLKTDKGKLCGDALEYSTVEPLAPGWAGWVLVARAAAYAKHRNNFATLFDAETMAPTITNPPMVRALEELATAAKLGPTDALKYGPAAARAAFWRGQCAMALTWPTAADKNREKAGPTANIRVGFAELPGSKQVYHPGNRTWDKRTADDDTAVALLGIAGRQGVVAKKAKNIEAAFQLLLWLSDSRMSPQVSAASPATTMFRQSNVEMPSAWVEKAVPATAAVQYGDVTQAALSGHDWLTALPLPGRAEYLAALDQAVADTVQGRKTAAEALQAADAQWRKITERLGIDKQRAAYRHSVGLD